MKPLDMKGVKINEIVKCAVNEYQNNKIIVVFI